MVDSDTRLERAILAYCEGLTLQSVDFESARLQFKNTYGLFRDLDLRWGMASALTSWGNSCAILGSRKDAQRRLEEGLAIWRALGSQSGESISLGFLAYLARMEGRFEEAATLAREAYVVSLELGSRGRSGLSRLFYGVALEHLGEFVEAQAFIEEGLALASDVGNHYRYTQVHSALVRIVLHRGRYQEARDLGGAGLALAREHGPRFSVGLNLLQLGCLDLATGDSASALERIQDSIAVYRKYEHTDDLSWGFAVLALAAHLLGKTDEATRHLLHALQIAVDVGVVPPLLWALPAAALLLAEAGEQERAVELYALASRYPLVAKSRWFEDLAGQQIATVAATLPAERVVALEDHGRTRDLDTTVKELVAELKGRVVIAA